ncbi:hypothetical protein [Actinomadura macrotermitis]|uniref:Uncharacterized protein n=1 Tax=Actinomadura macrotermitis TaxID=2585200 RepID=A0A7K0C208_9ACTN|nr:hypothetical protein [Actinomadura macrotermitis]MQY07122.1 hypothetical protein [Actinomadura macrotermitis]
MGDFFSTSAISFVNDDDDEDDYVMPPWVGPGEDVLGVTVPIGRILARTGNVVIALPHATVYPTGVLFDVRLAARREGLGDDAWDDLETTFFGHDMPRRRRGLPDTLCRYGVRLSDGAKATTVDSDPSDEGEPSGPVLTEHGGGGCGGGGRTLEGSNAYWLWPLPPEGPLQFVVEWPAAGIEETSLELDATALVAAAADVVPLWPEG